MNRKFIKRGTHNYNFFSLRNKLIFAAVLITLAVLFFFLNFRLFLGKIECSDSSGASCNDRLSARLKGLDGQRFFKALKGMKIIFRESPEVKKYSLRYLPPNNLKVTIVQSDAVFAVTNNSKDYFELINAEGQVVSIADRTDLPKLITDKKTDVGEEVPPEMLFALQVLKDLSRSFEVESASLTDDGMTATIKPDLTVIMPLSGDRQVLLGSLILIYSDLNNQNGSKLNTNGKKIGTIDLRFKNPVLK